ncbi:MAG: aryl-sulfate sulfotransferase [Cyclobacteriaceae bacterium]
MKRILTITLSAALAVAAVYLLLPTREGRFIQQVAIHADSTNALRMTAEITLEKLAMAKVAFWKEGQPVRYSEPSPVAIQHNITLLGLQEESTYQYKVLVNSGKDEIESGIYSFSTTSKPAGLVPIKWIRPAQNSYSGYILTQRRLVNGSVYIIDNQGEIVWYQMLTSQPKLASWTQHGTIVTLQGSARHKNSAGDRIIEYDLYGKEKLHLDLNEMAAPMEAHHEVRYHPNGHLLVLAYDEQTFDLSVHGGKKDHEVLGDAIVILSTEGEVVWRWSVFDHANPLDDPDILKLAEDWSHANAVSLDTDGHYLISFRNWNQVWKVDSGSGDVLWKLGKGGDLEMPEDGIFSGQHACHINPKGYYMLFDNGREKRQSRVLSFRIDEAEKRATLVKAVNLPDELYADKMGNAVLLENDNLLVCSPRTKALVVLDSLGTVLSHARLGLPDPYRAEYIPSLYPNEYGN